MLYICLATFLEIKQMLKNNENKKPAKCER